MNRPKTIVAAALLLCAVNAATQPPPAPPAAAAPLSFDVASIRPNNSSDLSANANFPLGPGDVYTPNGGHFTSTNFPLVSYIHFAFKILGNQAQSLDSQLPGWASTDRFDIQARTDGDPAKDTKDQMRLMMRSLLADRFKLAIHYETRQVPVFGLLPVKPGKTGPQLQAHPADSSCSTLIPTADGPGFDATVAGGYPALCGGLLRLAPNAPGRQHVGARNVTVAFIANQLAWLGNLGRPVLDQTGLTGKFDFALEWVPEANVPAPGGPDSQPDPSGATFMQALKEQLGLKLDSQKGPTEVLVVDHLEHLSEN